MSAPFNPSDCPCWREPGVYLEVRRKTISGGGVQLRLQCNTCGRGVGGAIARSKVDAPDACAPYDEGLEQRLLDAWREANQRAKEDQDAAWWARYNEYLSTPEWSRKRGAVLARDNFTCQACLSRQANQVHHLTYKHAFNEPLFDLVAVCKICHAKITEMYRQARCEV